MTGTSRDAEVATFANLVRLGVRDKVRLESMVLTDFRSTLQTLAKTKPDEIYNLAGQSSVGLSFDLPVETMESVSIGTLNLLESMRFLDLPARLYNSGSSECFGNTDGKPADETTPFYPRSPYAVAKAAAHWAVVNYREAYGLYACNGILFNHESPLRPKRFVTRKIVAGACALKAGHGEKLRLGNLDVWRDWGSAEEYVTAMWRMLQPPKAEDFVIATGETHSLRDFVETVFSTLDLDWQKYVEIDQGLHRPSDIAYSSGNPGKAYRDLGWRAERKMGDVIRLMVEDELSAMRATTP